MKIIIYIFSILILLTPIYASDDELQIIQGDDELYFNQILDLETGVIFSSDTTQQNSQIESTISTDGGSGKKREIAPATVKESNDEEGRTQNEVIRLNTDLAPSTIKSLFDIRIEVDPKSKQSAGKEILSIVKLLNLGKAGRVEASIKYLISDSQNDTILEEAETVFVETQKEFIKRFSLPKKLTGGSYKLAATLSYEDQEDAAYSEDMFYIEKKDSKLKYTKILVIGLISLVVLLITKIGKGLYKRKNLSNYGKK